MCLLILTPFLRRKMNTIKGRVAEPVAFFWKTTLCCSEPRQQQNHFSCSLAGLGEKKDCVLSYTISLKSDNVFKGRKSQLQYEEKGAGGLIGALSRECVLLSSESCQQMEVDGVDKRPPAATPYPPPPPVEVWLPTSSAYFLNNPPGFNRACSFQGTDQRVLLLPFSIFAPTVSPTRGE